MAEVTVFKADGCEVTLVPDLSEICPNCEQPMDPEHAHYRCKFCGYRDTCCDGAPQ